VALSLRVGLPIWAVMGSAVVSVSMLVIMRQVVTAMSLMALAGVAGCTIMGARVVLACRTASAVVAGVGMGGLASMRVIRSGCVRSRMHGGVRRCVRV
jgi:hypothetical protein